MKQDEATLNAGGQSNGNPSVGRQAFCKAVFRPAVALGLLTLCLSCAHLSARPVLVVFETELGNITVEVEAHTGMSGPYQTETLEPPIKILKAYRKEQAKAQIHTQAEARDKAAHGGIQREIRDMSGWTVHISRDLLATNAEATSLALKLLAAQLEGIVRVVPPAAVAELRKVSLWVSPEYPQTPPRAEYHPDAGWLRKHGRESAMAKGVEFTNVRIFESETMRMPVFALHELAHAYHDRVLGNNHAGIAAAYEEAKASGRYDKVQRRDARGRESIARAYAMTNPQEYFAETTEAFLGTNDFFPFTRAELKQHDPGMFTLLEKLWISTPQ